MAGADPFNRMMRFRWIMTGLSALVTLLLLASGAFIIGAVLAAMTVLRIVMLVKWQQRLAGRVPPSD